MKRKNLKNLRAFIIGVLAALFVFAGCASGAQVAQPDASDSANQTDAAAQTPAPVPEAAPEPAEAQQPAAESAETSAAPSTVSYPITLEGEKKLTYWRAATDNELKHIATEAEHEVMAEIKKKTGVDVTFIHPAVGQEMEQLDLLVVSDTLPDLVETRGWYSGGSSAGVEDGVFLDLTPYIEENAPDYLKAISISDTAYKLATSNDGKITSFQIIKESAPEFDRISFHTNIIEKYGFEVPRLMSDYDAIWETMKQDGMTGFILNANGRNPQFMWPFEITEGWFLDKDGSVAYGQYEPAYKDYLMKMNEWYTNEYISHDFMSVTTAPDRRAAFVSQSVGAFNGAVVAISNASTPVGLTLQPAPYPRMTEDQEIHFLTISSEPIPLFSEDMSTVVSANCANPELAIQYLNYHYTKEGSDLLNFGLPENYTVNADGSYTFTDRIGNSGLPNHEASDMYRIGQIAKLAQPDVICNWAVATDPVGLALRMIYSDDPADNAQKLPAFQLSLAANADRNDIMRDINTYIDEMTLKFITGVTPFTEFESYLETIKSMGIEDAIQITVEGYEAFMNKPGIPN